MKFSVSPLGFFDLKYFRLGKRYGVDEVEEGKLNEPREPDCVSGIEVLEVDLIMELYEEEPTPLVGYDVKAGSGNRNFEVRDDFKSWHLGENWNNGDAEGS